MEGKLKKNVKGYTSIPNSLINDSNLSFKAKGIWTYINSKPEGWDFSIDRIIADTNEGEKAVRSGLRELVEYGLLEYHAKKDPATGKFNGQHYILNDKPVTPKTVVTETGTTDKGNYRKGGVQSKKEISKKEISKKEEVEDTATAIMNKLIRLIPELENAPQLSIIVRRLRDMQDWESYAEFVAMNKRERWYDLNGWDKWFYKDYLSQPPEARIEFDPEIQAIIDRAMSRV